MPADSGKHVVWYNINDALFNTDRNTDTMIDDESSLHALVEGTNWWGIATLFRCELENDPRNVDIGLVGVPHSAGNGTSQRDQHYGPRAVRHVSAEYRRFHREFGINPWELCRIRDMGDPRLPHAMVNDLAMKDIQAFYGSLDAANVRPVSIGGDHSIVLPILRAIAGPQSNLAGEPIAVVHVDAHTDTYYDEVHYMGNKEWAGGWGVLMKEEGLVEPDCVYQIGIRGHGYAQTDTELGYNVIEYKEFQKLGVTAVVSEIRAGIGTDKPVYITFDLDALDPTVAPGVANVEAGEGMKMGEAMELLQGLRGMNVIGGDVVELVPTKDNPNMITSINASALMFEQITLIADYLSRQGRT